MVELRAGLVEDAQLAPLPPCPDRQLQWRARPHRARHATRVALGPPNIGLHPPVDLRRLETGMGTDDLGFVAAEQAQLVDGVRTDVHGRSAAELVLVADVLEHREWDAHRRLDPLDLAELAAGDDVVHPLGQRVVPVVERLHHYEPAAVSRRRDLLGLGGVGRERLLAQDVLAGCDRLQRPLGVQPVRQRVVDRIDVRIADDVVVRCVHLRDLVLARELLGAGRVARGNRHHLGVADLSCRLDQRARGDARCTQRADAHPVGRAHASTSFE